MGLKKEHLFRVNSIDNLAAQVTRGISFHEFEYLKQLSGSIDVGLLNKCTNELSSNGSSIISNPDFSFKSALSNSSSVRNLIPKTLAISKDEYLSVSSIGSFDYNPITTITTTATGSDNIQVNISKSNSLGIDLTQDEVTSFCLNIVKSKTIVSDPIFENTFNQSVISGFETSFTDTNLVSARIFPGNPYSDSHDSPNWLQDKVCKEGFQTVSIQLDKSKLNDIANTDLCDGGLYSTACVQGSVPTMDLWDLIFHRSSKKREFKHYMANTIIKQALVCNYDDSVSGDYSIEDATPDENIDKIIKIFKLDSSGGWSTSPVRALESDVLLGKNNVDKAKINAHILHNEIYDRKLLFNSINLFNTITNKKTGESRSIPSDEATPDTTSMNLNTGDPLGNIINECMEFKSKVVYRQSKEYNEYEHTFDSRLVEEYPNADLDFSFVDPRNGIKRSVRNCSDIFIQTDDTYVDPSTPDSASINRDTFIEEFKTSIFTPSQREYEVSFNKSSSDIMAEQLSTLQMDGGATYSQDQSGNIVKSVSKQKSTGSSSLTDTRLSTLSNAAPDNQTLTTLLPTDPGAFTNSASAPDLSAMSGALALLAVTTVADKVVNVIDAVPGLSVSESVKKAVDAAKTGAQILTVGVAVMSVIDMVKDLDSNLEDKLNTAQNIKQNTTSTSRMATTDSDPCEVIRNTDLTAADIASGITSKEEKCAQKKATIFVDNVIAFDQKINEINTNPPPENYYQQQRQKAERDFNNSALNAQLFNNNSEYNTIITNLENPNNSIQYDNFKSTSTAPQITGDTRATYYQEDCTNINSAYCNYLNNKQYDNIMSKTAKDRYSDDEDTLTETADDRNLANSFNFLETFNDEDSSNTRAKTNTFQHIIEENKLLLNNEYR